MVGDIKIFPSPENRLPLSFNADTHHCKDTELPHILATHVRPALIAPEISREMSDPAPAPAVTGQQQVRACDDSAPSVHGALHDRS